MLDAHTPSDMPIRMNFGNWVNFIVEAGYKPKKSEFTALARINSANARRNKIGGNNKGGRYVSKNGYVLLWMNGKYVQEHRYVMANKIGRNLLRSESVHHLNGIRNDNREVNLELWSTNHPSGQRVSDKIIWAIEFLKLYGYEHPTLSTN